MDNTKPDEAAPTESNIIKIDLDNAGPLNIKIGKVTNFSMSSIMPSDALTVMGMIGGDYKVRIVIEAFRHNNN